MHHIIYPLRKLAVDAGDADQVVHPGARDALQATEVLHEALAPLGADARHLFQRRALARIAARAHLSLQPFVVLQTGAATDKMVRDWPRPDTGINTHRAYALQWYVMALVGIILWVSLNLHREKAVEDNDSRPTGE